MYTFGWRLREVLKLQRRQLDLQAGTLTLDVGTTKNKEGRVAFLTPELKTRLAAQVERVKAWSASSAGSSLISSCMRSGPSSSQSASGTWPWSATRSRTSAGPGRRPAREGRGSRDAASRFSADRDAQPGPQWRAGGRGNANYRPQNQIGLRALQHRQQQRSPGGLPQARRARREVVDARALPPPGLTARGFYFVRDGPSGARGQFDGLSTDKVEAKKKGRGENPGPNFVIVMVDDTGLEPVTPGM